MSATLARARLCPLQRGFSFSVGRRGSGAKPWIQLRVRVGARAFSTPQEWTGLPAWRTNPVNDLRVWGKHGPQSLIHSTHQDVQDMMVALKKNPSSSGMDDDVFPSHWEKLQRLENSVTRGCASSLAEWGALVLRTADPVEKAVFTHHAYLLWSDGEIPLGVAQPPESPARPEKPELVHPRSIPPPNKTLLTPAAHALHNLAHIELNAIDLAWDTVVRFSSASEELDHQFFADFAHVADDESRHFLWCLQRLAELGFSYGDIPAHNLLLRDCQRTSRSVMARLAIIPMMQIPEWSQKDDTTGANTGAKRLYMFGQEARGLDAGPRLFDRLVGNGDNRSASIAKCIAEEEIAHVAVGVAWFLEVCRQLGKDSALSFQDLMKEWEVDLKGPFNHSARLTAGLPRDWYDLSYDPMEAPVTANGESSSVVRKSREQTTKISKQQASDHCHQVGEVNQAIDSTRPFSRLPEVFDRLAMVVAMEQSNADE